MPGIDMSTLHPVGEFGSSQWCEASAHYGVQILRNANLPEDIVWGFSETYTHAPERILDGGRGQSSYHIMVKNGEVSGGEGAPKECLELPGFHVVLPWALICNQSRSKYGSEGQRQRGREESVLFKAIEEYVGRENPMAIGDWSNAVWPREIAIALGKGSEDGAGLHNIAASLQSPSPEFSDLPSTDLGVPIFEEMTPEQRKVFVALCGVKLD